MLRTRFVPVALDQAYQRRQQDTEGEFYRKIAAQSPRNDFENTTQGFYVATSSGKLLLYNNNRDPDKVARLLKGTLEEFSLLPAANRDAAEIQDPTRDKRFNVSPPAGGLVVRARAKVLGGYEPTDDRWKQIFQAALSRDNLWMTAEEHQALVRGEFPKTVQRRLAMYHLVDNTRGEPPMWRDNEIRQLDIRLEDGRLSGTVHLETADGRRGYQAELLGFVESSDGQVTRFDLVVLGEFWGDGPFTRGAPQGKFPLAISLTLADGTDVADKVPPQGSRGWVEGYLR